MIPRAAEPPEQIPGLHVRPPMVYVREEPRWEYKLLVRDVAKAEEPSEDELNALGREGWELVGVLHAAPLVHFYFKRASV